MFSSSEAVIGIYVFLLVDFNQQAMSICPSAVGRLQLRTGRNGSLLRLTELSTVLLSTLGMETGQIYKNPHISFPHLRNYQMVSVPICFLSFEFTLIMIPV